MGAVVRFPGHKFMPREDGLAVCETCRAGEGQLPEDCPGRVMTEDEANMVYSGEIDYRVRHGGWTTWTREREMAARRLTE